MSAVAGVGGRDGKNKTAPDGCFATPELRGAKNELLLGIRLDLEPSCAVDVALQV